MAQLDGIVAKLGQAQKHLDCFRRDVRTFVESNPHGLVPQIEGDERVYYVRLSVPPITLSAVLGDILQNTRCALDYISAHLATIASHSKKHTPLFPIFDKLADWQASQSVKDLASLAAVPAFTLIEGLQPYHTAEPTKHPLSILRELSNADKHRALRVVAGIVAPDFFTHQGDVGHQFEPVFGVLRDGAEAGRCPVKDSMDVKAHGTQSIVMKEPGPWGDTLVDTLCESIIGHVRDCVVPPFKPFF